MKDPIDHQLSPDDAPFRTVLVGALASRRGRTMRGTLTMCALLAGFGGCGLRLDLFEGLGDAGPTPPPACVQQLDAATDRCVVASPTCALADPCPATFSLANSQSSCTGNSSINVGSCGGMNTWVRYREFSVLSCYYDASSGLLQGAHADADNVDFCGGKKSELWVGNVPANCSLDGGSGITGSFNCPTDVDGGAFRSPVPCGNQTCTSRQYCRASNANDDAGTCDPAAGVKGGTCVDIPIACGGVLTCGCLAGSNTPCRCCFPRGGGTVSCSGS